MGMSISWTYLPNNRCVEIFVSWFLFESTTLPLVSLEFWCWVPASPGVSCPLLFLWLAHSNSSGKSVWMSQHLLLTVSVFRHSQVPALQSLHRTNLLFRSEVRVIESKFDSSRTCLLTSVYCSKVNFVWTFGMVRWFWSLILEWDKGTKQ